MRRLTENERAQLAGWILREEPSARSVFTNPDYPPGEIRRRRSGGPSTAE